MKKQLCALLGTAILLLAACGKDAPAMPTTEKTTQTTATTTMTTMAYDDPSFAERKTLVQALNAALDGDTAANFEKLQELFLQYYSFYAYELSQMPQFDAGETIDWGELASWIYDICDQAGMTGGGFLLKGVLESTAQALLGEFPYAHQSSSSVQYEQGRYQSRGWNYSGSKHAWLESIEKTPFGDYAATFNVFYLSENEYIPDEEIAQTIRDNPRKFESTYKATITFERTDNAVFPFVYKSCYVGETRYPEQYYDRVKYAAKLREALLQANPPQLTDELREAFFNYYYFGTHYLGDELVWIPNFEKVSDINTDWDAFLFLMASMCDMMSQIQEYEMNTKNVEEISQRFFSGFEVKHRDGKWFLYENDMYKLTESVSDAGSHLDWPIAIQQTAADCYTITLNQYVTWDEDEDLEALWQEYKLTSGEESPKYADMLLQTLKNTPERLDVWRIITISVRLTEDEVFPLLYTKCIKTEVEGGA
ncbi:MAG: hypothetical protein LBS96_03775 [Oscillospiraceae bacterium]|jgi:hypothetical protein|nr:hypothetical protein [Oscillospiraceae bacterium]